MNPQGPWLGWDGRVLRLRAEAPCELHLDGVLFEPVAAGEFAREFAFSPSGGGELCFQPGQPHRPLTGFPMQVERAALRPLFGMCVAFEDDRGQAAQLKQPRQHQASWAATDDRDPIHCHSLNLHIHRYLYT